MRPLFVLLSFLVFGVMRPCGTRASRRLLFFELVRCAFPTPRSIARPLLLLFVKGNVGRQAVQFRNSLVLGSSAATGHDRRRVVFLAGSNVPSSRRSSIGACVAGRHRDSRQSSRLFRRLGIVVSEHIKQKTNKQTKNHTNNQTKQKDENQGCLQD